MSPGGDADRVRFVCFPGVSGDEPGDRRAVYLGGAFSPRERG